jgi:multidrug efflux pump subunit AcrB
MIIVLGIISYNNMTTDLLPAMELPYVVVVTTYPGASPEKVEQTVTRPLESAVLGTSSGLKNI